MVLRKLNKPTYKVRSYPVFWLQEIKTSTWFCRDCGENKSAGSVAFELYVRYARKNSAKTGSVDAPVRLYLCLDCAENMLTTSLTKVRLAKNYGPQGFKMFDEV